MLRKYIYIYLPILLSAATAAAAAPQNESPVYIEADSMNFDMVRGISEYRGNVRVSRESFVLTGDLVVVRQHEGDVESIHVEGAPARYSQQDESGGTITASSRKMDYKATENRLVLQGDARVTQPGQSIESQRITYDTVEQVVVAGQNAPDERVNITITPEKKASP